MNNLINMLNIICTDDTQAIVPVLIAVLIIFVPVVILALIVFVKILIKATRPTNGTKTNKKVANAYDWQLMFGGKDNIENTEVNLNRVAVTVKDLTKVSMDDLKAHQISALITGNTVKCSSSELVALVENTK